MRQYIIMMAVAASTIFASCSKDNEVTQPATSQIEGQEITISFSNDAVTRAFFDENAEAEAWEKSISKATLILERYSDPSGYAVESVRKVLTTSEIASGKATISLSSAEANNMIVAGIGANIDVPDGVNALKIYNDVVSQVDVTEFNGTFDEVSTSSKRAEGFALYGMGVAVVESSNNIDVPMQLERNVAKIAIQTSISDKFNNSSYFGGDLRVDDITVRAADVYNPDFSTCFTFTQAAKQSGSYFQNLFYIGQSSNNDFTISATYDADGNFNTTNDQTPVTYIFSITNANGSMKELLSNSYYRVNLTINSMDSTGVEISISVADWVSVDDQTVEIG